jgi:hypothetical protein
MCVCVRWKKDLVGERKRTDEEKKWGDYLWYYKACLMGSGSS